jgi:hypothetical protein
MLAPPNKNEMAPTVRDSRGQMSARQLIVVYAVEITNAVWFSVELKDSVKGVKRHMEQTNISPAQLSGASFCPALSVLLRTW